MNKPDFSASSSGRTRTAEWMLVLATFFWGWTFPVVKEAVAVMPVFAFLTLRFALAAALLSPFVFFRGNIGWRDVKVGLLPGGLLFLAFAFQTLGLAHTGASKAAFITGLNVIWVAFVAARSRNAWIGVGLGVASLWVLTAPTTDAPNIGDWLILVCSFFIAAHIIVLARLKENAGSGKLAFVQFAVIAALSLPASLLFEPSLLPSRWNGELIFALLLTTFGATVCAFWLQTHFQRRTTPVRAALIFILEPVFAAFFAVVFYGETLPPAAWAGGVLILLAMVVTAGELGGGRRC